MKKKMSTQYIYIYVVSNSNNEQGRIYDIINFMSTGAARLCAGFCHICLKFSENAFLLKNSFLYTQGHILDKQGKVQQNCKCHDFWSRGSCARD